MRGRLLVLNLLLLAGCAAAWMRLRAQMEAHERRQREFLRATAPPPAPPALALPSPPPQISAANYLEVAEKLLLSRDRNPTVIIEVSAPKPVPPLPRYYGLMNFGEGPRIILAPHNKPQKSYVVGDQVGEFRLVALEPSGLVFEWEGKQIRKRFDELKDQGEPPPAQQASAGAAPGQPAPAQNISTVSTVSTIQERKGPGAEAGENYRYCQPGDSTPPGTIMEGYRKVVRKSPFGDQCLWEKVQ
ncbi:MAG: hypothetical protein N2036_01035 [Bryobacteraceae bacterium]|nr:hypothetical protein [Bryobacteraceae bacterium]